MMFFLNILWIVVKLRNLNTVSDLQMRGPFRLPYRRIPPAHYQKLRIALTEMEEQGIIRKSVSEYASPLVLVWKKMEVSASVPTSGGLTQEHSEMLTRSLISPIAWLL